MKELDVKTYKVDLVEYMCYVLFILFSFQRDLKTFTQSIRHFNTNILSKFLRI